MERWHYLLYRLNVVAVDELVAVVGGGVDGGCCCYCC